MKKNNSLLITILSGAIFCFVCLGMVLLFPGNTKKLKSEESPLPNLDEHGYVEDEEISLGDEDGCNYSCSWTLAGSTSVTHSCASAPGSTTLPSASCSLKSATVYNNTGAVGTSGDCNWTKKTYNIVKNCASCKSGYKRDGNSCTSCPVGHYCSSGEAIACEAGTSSTGGTSATSPSACSPCADGQISQAGGACERCGDGKTSNSTHTVCVNQTTGCDAGEYKGSEACERCPNGYTSNAGSAFYITDCYANISAGQQIASAHAAPSACPANTYSESSAKIMYGDSRLCTPCPSNKETAGTGATSASQCVEKVETNDPVITCLNPRYTGASQTIATCANGTITSGGTAVEHGSHTVSCQGSKLVSKECSIIANEGTVCCCTSDKSMCSWKNSCTSSQPYPIQGVGSEQNCKKQETTPDDCTIGVSIRSKATSITTDGENDINSYYTVTVSIRGKNCGGKTATYTATNGRPSPSSYTVPTGSVSSTVSFNVYPSDPCKDSCATASINGKSATACLGSDDSIRTDWQPKENVCEKNPQYTAFYLADEAGANIYYSNYDQSKGCYTTQWKRYLCGRSGTPTTPTTPEAPHCYVDNDGEYHWSIYTESSWKIVDTITKEENCKKDETPACYISPSGEYVWGKHGKDDGYVLITSITDSSACKTPTPEEACYKKDNDYKWTSTQPEGYTKVETAKTPAECAPSENPACYLHGNSFVWGKYAKVSGYIFVENIEEEQYCKTPDNDACYVDSKGDYVWGKYGSTEGYTLVPSVTEMSQCKNNVPVPKTGISISKIIYIFMAILMAFGVGFIYYSSAVKKND